MLSSVDDKRNPGGEKHEDQGMQEPSERCEAEVIGSDSTVEMAAGRVGDLSGALRNLVALLVQTIMGGNRADPAEKISPVPKTPPPR